MSIKWSLLYKMTGSLWLDLRSSFNNLASNLVHVVSNSEVDSLQIVRTCHVMSSYSQKTYQKLTRKLIVNPYHYN